MVGLIEQPVFHPSIRQIEETDPLHGGPPNEGEGLGQLNIAPKQLGDRTAWLREQVISLQQTLNDITNGAPGALDTLNELATALGDDPNFAATILAEIGDTKPKVGSGLTWYGFAPPPGYFELAGSEHSRDLYADLWAHSQTSGMYDPDGLEPTKFGPGNGVDTFTIPDVRALVQKSWDNGAGIDDGRALGSFQEGTQIGDRVGENADFGSVVPIRNGRAASSEAAAITGWAEQGITGVVNTVGFHTYYHTDMANIAVMHCIKY